MFRTVEGSSGSINHLEMHDISYISIYKSMIWNRYLTIRDYTVHSMFTYDSIVILYLI